MVVVAVVVSFCPYGCLSLITVSIKYARVVHLWVFTGLEHSGIHEQAHRRLRNKHWHASLQAALHFAFTYSEDEAAQRAFAARYQ